MSEENKITLNKDGDIEINDEFLNDISGGSNPEDTEDEGIVVNIYCPGKKDLK